MSVFGVSGADDPLADNLADPRGFSSGFKHGLPPCTRKGVNGQDGRVQRVVAYALGASKKRVGRLVGECENLADELLWVHDHSGFLYVIHRSPRLWIEWKKAILAAWRGPITWEGPDGIVKFIWVGEIIAEQIS